MTTDVIRVEHYRPPRASVGWYIASYNGIKATGASPTEALGHLLLTLRGEVEVVSIELRPVDVGSRRNRKIRT